MHQHCSVERSTHSRQRLTKTQCYPHNAVEKAFQAKDIFINVLYMQYRYRVGYLFMYCNGIFLIGMHEFCRENHCHHYYVYAMTFIRLGRRVLILECLAVSTHNKMQSSMVLRQYHPHSCK